MGKKKKQEQAEVPADDEVPEEIAELADNGDWEMIVQSLPNGDDDEDRAKRLSIVRALVDSPDGDDWTMEFIYLARAAMAARSAHWFFEDGMIATRAEANYFLQTLCEEAGCAYDIAVEDAVSGIADVVKML